MMTTPDNIEILQHSEFFKQLGMADIQRIAAICQTAELNEGDYLFQQGDLGEHIYVIVSGQMMLERSMDIGLRKGNLTIETLGRGRLLGCWSTLLGETHILMASARCKRKAAIITINGADLRQMMTSNTSLGFNLLERLCFLLRDRIQAAYGALEKI